MKLLTQIKGNIPTTVKILTLNGNDFSVVDHELRQLKVLEILDLQRSRIQIISHETFSENTNLKNINLGNFI